VISETVRVTGGNAVPAPSLVHVPLGTDPKAPVLVLDFAGVEQKGEEWPGGVVRATETYVKAGVYVQSHTGAVGERAELTMTVPDAVRLGLILGAEVVES